MAYFKNNPSNVATAATDFLKSLKVAAKTKRQYEDTLWLFIESLKGDGLSCIELPDGSYVLNDNWDSYYGGAVSSFIDWFLPRKVMMPDDEMRKIPGVLRKFIQWSYDHDFFDKEHYDDYMDSLPKSKSGEVKRLRELEKNLYQLHSPDTGAWARGEQKKVQSIAQKRQPEEIAEGYMVFVQAEAEKGFFKLGKKKIGPVLLTLEIASKFKIGDVANLTVGRFGKIWMVLETGNVYPEGTM